MLISLIQFSLAAGFYGIGIDVSMQKEFPSFYAKYVENPAVIISQSYIYFGIFIAFFLTGMFIRRQKEWARKGGIIFLYCSIGLMLMDINISKGITLLWHTPFILLSGAIIYYLNKLEIKNLFKA